MQFMLQQGNEYAKCRLPNNCVSPGINPAIISFITFAGMVNDHGSFVIHSFSFFFMKELNDIILAYDKAVMQNKQTALATVVKVDGSSYRRPGAPMLITEDGQMTGAISGGCLEGDALRKAQLAILQQKN